MGNPAQIDLGGNTLVVTDIVLASTPGGSQTSLSATEIAALDGVTAGTATASKAVVLNSSKGISTITSATITTLTATDVNTTTVTPTTIAGAANFSGTPTFAAGATVTGTVTATGQFSGGLQSSIVEDGANVVLTAPQSGSLCIFDKTDGALFTLPTPAVGLEYTFVVNTADSTGNHKVITNAGTVFISGSLVNWKLSDSTNLVCTGNGSTHVAITMDGTTKGGLAGSWFKLVCRTATKWEIAGGTLYGSGTIATPFATS